MCDRGQGPRNWSSGPVLPRWLALGHVVWFGRTTTIIPIIIPPPPEKEALLRSSRRRGGGSFRHGVRMTEGFICSPAPKYSVALSYSTRFFSAVAAISLSSPMPAMLTVSTFIPSLFPPTVSRVGRMSSAFSHSESRSVEILAHRSRVLSRPSGDSMSMAVIPSSSSLGDSGTTNALVTMQSFFNVDYFIPFSTGISMPPRRLVKVRKNYFIPPNYERHVPLSGEHPYDAFSCGFSLSTDALKMFNLGKMKSGSGVGSDSVMPTAASAPAVGDAGVSMVEKRPSSGVEAGLRKRLRKVAIEQLADASRITARTSADKGKGTVELEEVPEQGYTMRELCKVED
ncbi:hypothetical protein GW17_00052646 [Ensete ventricosum]|nr:hypothetical protein GW17_00052646 [Ensete ventricosum]